MSARAQVDLIAIARELAPGLHPIPGGRYLEGPCPFCGGRDRFQVKVGHGGQPDRWLCRGCTGGRYQDAAGFVMRRDRVTYRHALALLQTAPMACTRTEQPEVDVPPDAWRSILVDALEASEDRLGRATSYLRSRGLTIATASAWRLGYVDDGTGHGLPAAPRTPEDPTRDMYLSAPALVIPWRRRGVVEAVKLRLLGGEGRYLSVWGSRPVLFGADTAIGKRVGVLCEGELDTMLLWQHAGDLVATITLGSCRPEFPTEAIPDVLGLHHVLVAYDVDQPGEQACQRLLRTSKRLRRVRPPVPAGRGKDLTDAWRAGVDLRVWVLAALREVGS